MKKLLLLCLTIITFSTLTFAVDFTDYLETDQYVSNAGESIHDINLMTFGVECSSLVMVDQPDNCISNDRVLFNFLPHLERGESVSATIFGIPQTDGKRSGTDNFLVAPAIGLTQDGTVSAIGKTFAVNQTTDCTYTLSTTSITLGSGGYGNVNITTDVGCQWTAVSNDSWITVTNNPSGSGGGTVFFATAANNTGFARSGTITIAGQTFTVNQADTCIYSLSSTSQTSGANATTGGVAVYTGAGCVWTAVSNDSWITITSGASGTGNNLLVLFSIAANTGTAARTGTLTIAGQTYTVVQPAPCRYSIAPSNASIGENGGSGSFSVFTDTSCNWTAHSLTSSVKITSGLTGRGNGTVTFSVDANLGLAQSFRITVADQTFTIAQAAITIPALRIESYLRSETNSGMLPLTFEVALSEVNPTIPRTQTVTVDFATADGTAIAGEDYIATSGTLTFAPGETTKFIPVPVIGDYIIEPDETFTVKLSNPVNATLYRAVGEGTIWNDDNGGTFYFSSANTVSESAGNAVVTVARVNGAASGVSVNYSTLNGTATAGQDYTAASGTLTFGAGETSKTFFFPISNDAVIEPNETINLKLSNPSGGATFGAPGTSAMSVLTIVDDDVTPSLSIDNVRNYEDSFGAFNFRIILSGAVNQTVTVDYSTADGTAVAGQDYVAASGTLSFAPGETTKYIPVVVRSGFNYYEENETFTVNLSNPVNAAIANAQGTATIIHDDFEPTSGCTRNVFPTNMNLGAEVSSGNTFSVVIQAHPFQNCGTFNAATSSSFITIDSRYSPFSSNGIGTGSVAFSVAANTGEARSGTISVAGQTFTINQAAGMPLSRRVLFDFDGDRKSDISVFRPSNGYWYISKSSGGYSFIQWGLATDTPVPGDYDFDGKTDLAIYRRSGDRDGSSVWYILRSSDNTFSAKQLGRSGFLGDDLPTPADYDGDGKTDLAVYTGSDALFSPSSFIIIQSSTNFVVTTQWGLNTDKRVVADYDGDGRDDLAVYRYSTLTGSAGSGTWYVQQSTNGATRIEYFGLPSDTVVPGDYDGDGQADVAVWRPSNGTWYWISSRDKSFNSYQFGLFGDKPVPDDYDGDGKTDFAVFRPSNGVWYIQQSMKGFRAEQFGLSTDVPIPNVFVR